MAGVGIAAGGQTLFIDATRASRRQLRRLARALPWRRPVDGVAVLASAEGLPPDGIARAADFARAVGMRVAVHMVLPSRSAAHAWRIIDADNRNGDAICSQLAADTVRIWLKGGEREGLEELALAQTRDLPGAMDRALSVAPSSLVDVASLGFSGAGLRGAVAQTVGRTRPATTRGAGAGIAWAVCAAGLALAALTAAVTLDRVETLRGAVAIAKRDAVVPWTIEEVEAVPNGTRVRRVAGIADSLAGLSAFSLLSPLASLLPDHSAPGRLGAALIDSYLLRPLGSALERQARERLVPSEDAEDWLEDARLIGDWIAAWEALSDDPREVDMKSLLAAAFGGVRDEWPDDLDLALIETGVAIPLPGEGGFDVAAVTELARDNFVLTMRMWADAVYTNGPVATAARRAGDPGVGWREQHAALLALRAALQDPAQRWLTAAEDRSDHTAELRILGRALALGLIGQVVTVEAKAAVARIRIDARAQAARFDLRQVGALLVRASGDTGSLRLSPDAVAWLRYLDKVAGAGFAEPPPRAGAPIRGVVTLDPAVVARTREKLRTYDRLAMNLPADLPAAAVRDLLAELGSQLVLGVVTEIENALRADDDLGLASARAERRAAAAAAALDEMAEMELWLEGQQALAQADRLWMVRARIADGVLTAAAEALEEEDPLGVHVDPTADANAVVRRLERGLARLRSLHEQFAEPFLDVTGGSGASWVALHWSDIAGDLAAWARGDSDSELSVLEGNVRAWAENPEGVCEAPRSPTGRGDYVARSAARFRAEVDAVCEASRVAVIERHMQEVNDYYDLHLKRLWPFSGNGPEVGATALAEFVEKLHAGAEVLPQAEGRLAASFVQHAAFWTPGEGASVRFRSRWRWREDVESLAHHVAEVRFEGVETEETGVHVWRYGEPFAVHFRLAKNSPWQFRLADGRLAREWSISPGGQGPLLRVLEGMTQGEMLFEADLFDTESGDVETLRLTARFVHEDGRPMAVPRIGDGSG